MKRLVLIFMLLGAGTLVSGQITRIGSCRTANEYDKNYLTPYLFAGKLILTQDSIKTGKYSYGGGLTYLRKMGAIKMGLGVRYVFLSQSPLAEDAIKPYLALELPLSFGDFSDFGLYAAAGPSISLPGTLNNTGFFADLGFYFHFVLSENSGLFLGADYGYNALEQKTGIGLRSLNYHELKALLGYRFWF